MTDHEPNAGKLRVGSELTVRTIGGVPGVEPGADLFELIAGALDGDGVRMRDSDVVVVASKIVSRAEGRFVDLAGVDPGEAATTLAAEIDKDPRLVELILGESVGISRKTRGALIVRHRLGFVSANAGIDSSNAAPASAATGSGPWVLLLPVDPDGTAESLRQALAARYSVNLAVVITDSWGRPFRRGTVGFALGVAGLPPVWDRRGSTDRHGRVLEATESGVADAVAAAADLVAGQADEGRPLTLVRGLSFPYTNEAATSLLRDPENDLYA